MKVIRSEEIYDIIEHEDCYKTDDLYYLKSEADKVIAELNAQKAQAEDDCAYWKSKAQRERHANYKRCLAMAKWCEMGISYWDDDEQEGGWEYKKLRHCIRWKKRWLEIAEQFTTKSGSHMSKLPSRKSK